MFQEFQFKSIGDHLFETSLKDTCFTSSQEGKRGQYITKIVIDAYQHRHLYVVSNLALYYQRWFKNKLSALKKEIDDEQISFNYNLPLINYNQYYRPLIYNRMEKQC